MADSKDDRDQTDAFVSETWENTYSGFDRDACRDVTGWVVEAARKHLPQPVISPTCKRQGHDWQELPPWKHRRYFSKGWSRLYGCSRCAKRGMIVFRTDALEPKS